MKYAFRTLFVFAALIGAGSSPSQAQSALHAYWSAALNGEARNVKVNSRDEVLVATSLSVQRFARDGTLLASWSPPSSELRLDLDPAENVVVGGGWFVGKYTPDGTLLWQVTPPAPVSAVAVDRTGNVYAAGGWDGCTTLKLDASGNLLWVRSEPVPPESTYLSPIAVLLTAAQGVIVLNRTNWSGYYPFYYQVTYDEEGNLASTYRGYGYPNDGTVAPFGGAYYVGESYYGGPYGYNCYWGYFGASTDAQMSPMPNYDSACERFRALSMAPDGDVLIAGDAVVTGPQLSKYDLTRTRIWAAALPHFAQAIAVDSAGAILAAGGTQLSRLAVDADGDGYDASVDCNDSDASIYPGANEVKHDGVDQDCNGYDLTIDVLKANYDPAAQQLHVVATSTLGASAMLELVGYGAMTFKSNVGEWAITASSQLNPGTVTVSGIEGATTAQVK